MKIPADKLAALQRGAAAMNSPGIRDLLRWAEIVGEISRRSIDPDGRNEAIAARLAARMRAGTTAPGEGDELLDLAAGEFLPRGFLADVQRLVARPAEDSRQHAYLVALVAFRSTEGRWPFAAEADRHAAKIAPKTFAAMGDPAIDGKKAFKALRKQLALDWLPKGKAGRRPK